MFMTTSNNGQNSQQNKKVQFSKHVKKIELDENSEMWNKLLLIMGQSEKKDYQSGTYSSFTMFQLISVSDWNLTVSEYQLLDIHSSLLVVWKTSKDNEKKAQIFSIYNQNNECVMNFYTKNADSYTAANTMNDLNALRLSLKKQQEESIAQDASVQNNANTKTLQSSDNTKKRKKKQSTHNRKRIISVSNDIVEPDFVSNENFSRDFCDENLQNTELIVPEAKVVVNELQNKQKITFSTPIKNRKSSSQERTAESNSASSNEESLDHVERVNKNNQTTRSIVPGSIEGKTPHDNDLEKSNETSSFLYNVIKVTLLGIMVVGFFSFVVMNIDISRDS